MTKTVKVIAGVLSSALTAILLAALFLPIISLVDESPMAVCEHTTSTVRELLVPRDSLLRSASRDPKATEAEVRRLADEVDAAFAMENVAVDSWDETTKVARCSADVKIDAKRFIAALRQYPYLDPKDKEILAMTWGTLGIIGGWRQKYRVQPTRRKNGSPGLYVTLLD